MNKQLIFQVVILFIALAFLLGSVILRRPMTPVQHSGLVEIEDKYGHLKPDDAPAFQLEEKSSSMLDSSDSLEEIETSY